MSIEAVALPPRSIGVPVSTIWSLDSNEKAGDVSEKDYQRCSKDSDVSSNRTVCCRETKGQDERRLINPDILRDLIIGFSDGISVPFALASGLSALGNTKIVVISVTAELLSGAIAMGIGGFLAAQGDRDQYLYWTANIEDRMKRCCVGEIEREVHEVLSTTGVEMKVSSVVAASLYRAEKERVAPNRARFFARPSLWFTEKIGGDVGLTPFLVHYGKGMSETTRLRMVVSGITVGMGYLIGGIIPLMPYLIVKDDVLVALWYSIGFTSFVLLVFGAAKTWYTGAGQGKGKLGILVGAVWTLGIAATAAACAFGLVVALEG